MELAFDFASNVEANANQGGLFEMGAEDDHGASTKEPELIFAVPWGVKERLGFEKTAVGFYLSGHLFDEVATEVRQFVKRKIDDLIDSREPQLLAGIVNDFRVINGQRGKLALFKLDDKSASVDARADEALWNANKNLLKEDEFIVVMGKLQPDRFSGGMQLTVNQIWSLEQARCRFGKYLKVAVNRKAPDVAQLLKDFPAVKEMTDQGELLRGMAVRLSVLRDVAVAEDAVATTLAFKAATADLHLSESARFYPTDAALAGWRAQAHNGQAAIIYEEAVR